MAFFWKGKKPAEIRKKIKKLKKKIVALSVVKDKKNEMTVLTETIREAMPEIVNAINKRAEEEKKRPSVDSSYDVQIDKLASAEVAQIEELERTLAQLEEMLIAAESEGDVDAVVDLLLEEEAKIEARDQQAEKAVDDFETATLRDRVSAHVRVAMPRNNLKDGVPFNDVQRVVRELGGWIEKAGTHSFTIRFPGARRPIPLSNDVGSELIAGQIKAQLAGIYPLHKVPTRASLREALARGHLPH